MGEHVEMHMYIGGMAKGTKMTGYLERNLLEPAIVAERHDELAAEMVRRGYRHDSPVDQVKLAAGKRNLSNYEMATTMDRSAARAELLSRCPECLQLYEAGLTLGSG